MKKEGKSITLKYDDFSLPEISDQRVLFSNFEDLKGFKVGHIKTRFELFMEKETNNFTSHDIENKYIGELKTLAGTAKFFLTHLYFYSYNDPNILAGGKNTANSVFFETFYEAFYSKLSSSFDRFLHLVNIYYNLNLKKNYIRYFKGKLKKRSEEIEHKFNDLLDDPIYLRIKGIRNKFIHNELIYHNSLHSSGDFFGYSNMFSKAVEDYMNYVEFINKRAIPFLYQFDKHLVAQSKNPRS